MKNKKTIVSLVATLGLVASCGLVTYAIAAGGQRADRTGSITPWKAMELAEKKTGGKAIEAVFEYDDGHWGYAVYVVAKGKLFEVELSKDSGKFGDVEQADPAGEAKELEGDLKRALKS